MDGCGRSARSPSGGKREMRKEGTKANSNIFNEQESKGKKGFEKKIEGTAGGD